jgi:hypothetical protein
MNEQLPKLPEINPAERVFCRPSWIDPSLIVNLTEWTFRDVTVSGATPFLIAGNSPIRIGIAFTKAPTNATSNFISPTQIPGSFGQTVTSNIKDNLFTIFEHFSMVNSEWYCQGTAPSIIRVWEWSVQE